MKHIHEQALVHINSGCLSDSPDLPMYIELGVYDQSGLPRLVSRRGTSALEGSNFFQNAANMGRQCDPIYADGMMFENASYRNERAEMLVGGDPGAVLFAFFPEMLDTIIGQENKLGFPRRFPTHQVTIAHTSEEMEKLGVYYCTEPDEAGQAAKIATVRAGADDAGLTSEEEASSEDEDDKDPEVEKGRRRPRGYFRVARRTAKESATDILGHHALETKIQDQGQDGRKLFETIAREWLAKGKTEPNLDEWVKTWEKAYEQRPLGSMIMPVNKDYLREYIDEYIDATNMSAAAKDLNLRDLCRRLKSDVKDINFLGTVLATSTKNQSGAASCPLVQDRSR